MGWEVTWTNKTFLVCYYLSQMKVVLCSKERLRLLQVLIFEGNAEHRVSKTVARLAGLQPRHDVKGVRRGADEETALAEVLGGVPQHAVGLWEALEAVVEGKLTADQVKLLLWILVKLSRSLLLH